MCMEFNWFKIAIEKISLAFNYKKENSPSLKIENKAKEATTQIGQVNIRQEGLTYSEVKDLITSVVDQKLLIFKDEAISTFNGRRDDFKKLLIDKVKDLPEQEIAKFKEPDVQLALMEATKISGRKQSGELRNLLADLVVSRIKNDSQGKEELKNIVYNEAISTVNKITIDQLKIITLCYLLHYTSYNAIISWDTFKTYIETHLKPFLDFKNTEAEFQHIEYASCGSLSIGSWDFINIYRQQYSFLFQNLIEQDQLDSVALPAEIKREIAILDAKENKYFIRIRNKEELEKYLKNKKIDEEIIKKLAPIYETHIKNNTEIKSKIMEETESGKKLMEIWENSPLKHLSLTSVGIAIAASFFEQVVGEKINIDIWIN